MAKSKSSIAASDPVNGQVVDAVTQSNVKVLKDWQQQAAQGVYQLLEIGLQNNLAAQQLVQDTLGTMSGMYKSYSSSLNGMTQHSWAAYSSLFTDPWGLSSGTANEKDD